MLLFNQKGWLKVKVLWNTLILIKIITFKQDFKDFYS